MDHRQAIETEALELRLGEAEVPIAAPDVAAFAAPAAAPSLADPEDPEDELRLLLVSAGLVGGPLRRPADDVRLVPLVDEGGAWPIPAPAIESVQEDMSLETWSIAPVCEATIALVERRPPEPAPRWRPLVIAAVSLPLLLGPGEAWAAPTPAVQRPKASEPAAAPEAAREPAPEPVLEPPPLEAPEAPAPAAAPEPDPEGAAAPAGDPGDGLTVPDWQFQAMQGLEVSLTFARGGRRKGRLIKADGPNLLFVDYQTDGRLVTVPKAEVLELRGAVPAKTPFGVPDPSLPRGTGMLVTGGIATAIGVPFFLTGAVFLAISPSFGSFFLVPGIVGLAAGIPLLVYGSRRRRAYLDSAYRTARLTPGVAPTRGGWTGGLTLRF